MMTCFASKWTNLKAPNISSFSGVRHRLNKGFVAIAACSIFLTASDFSVGCTYTVDFLRSSLTSSAANARRFINSFRISNSSSKSSALRHASVFFIWKAAVIFCLYSLGSDEPAPMVLPESLPLGLPSFCTVADAGRGGGGRGCPISTRGVARASLSSEACYAVRLAAVFARRCTRQALSGV
jgi:hypothetical protein